MNARFSFKMAFRLGSALAGGLVVALAAGCSTETINVEMSAVHDMAHPQDEFMVPGRDMAVSGSPDMAMGMAPADMGGCMPGPDPFNNANKRLSIGAFYDPASPATGYSDIIAIDDKTTHFYVYDNTLAAADSPDHIEGCMSTRLVYTGQGGYFGMGINWDAPHDLGAWKTLHVSLKSAAPSFADLKIQMADNTKAAPFVLATKYGYKNDGAWHNLAIPTADFVTAGWNPAMAKAGIILLNGAGTAGDAILVDNVHFDTP